MALAAAFPLALLSLTGVVRKRRTVSRIVLGLALLAILGGSTLACGHDQFISATPAGTYPITFTATGSNQGGSAPITHTLTLNVVIAP